MTFLLIRHAAHDLLGRALAGRMAGVSLNAEGRRQAAELAGRLAGLPVGAVISGPLERARETAEPLAARLGLAVQVEEAIDEIDYGEWTGRTFAELEGIPRWHRYNSFRSGTRVPGGESMLEAQARAVAYLERLRDEAAHACVALVSHGDILKAALAYSLGAPLDLFQRLEISPASVSLLELTEFGPRVLAVNHTGPLRLG